MTKKEAIILLKLVRGDNPKKNDAVAQAIDLVLKELEEKDGDKQ